MASATKHKTTGKWVARYNLTDKHGNRQQRKKNGFDTKKEALIYANKQELDDNIADSEVKLVDYFRNWYETFKEGKVSQSTEEQYEYLIKLIEDYFGNLKLKDLTRIKYQAFLNERGKNRAKNTVEKTHFRIKRCIEIAFADGIIKTNPTHNIQLNYDIKEQKLVKAWNVSEAEKLMDLFTSELTPRATILYIAINTGLRLGEIYGLSWKDIHGTTLEVNRGYAYNNGERNFTDAKTPSSIRKIKVTKEFTNQIKKYKLKYQSISPEYLFLDEWNHPVISDTGVRKYLKKSCRELDIPVLGIHSLRHTHCSYLLYKGIDINYISKRLGHSNITETLKIYTHILGEFKEEQDEKLLEVLEGLN